ncbi:MAG: GNAT family N-acetyltransferase [Cohaesibacter sp.]|nr:GNAT family N-acetyltransferase [Cohaesibacter sp.]
MKFELSAEFDFASSDYGALYQVAQATAFQHPKWQLAMQAHIARLEGISLQCLAIRDETNNKLLGLFPLIRRPLMGTYILEFANLGLVDYAAPILHPDLWSKVKTPADLYRQMEDVLAPYDLLRIKHLRADDLAIAKFFPQAQLRKAAFSAHSTDLFGSFADWQAAKMSRTTRRSNNRKRKALGKQGVFALKVLKDPDDIERAFLKLQTFRQHRFHNRLEKDYCQDPAAFEFYLKLAKDGARDGYTITYQFTLDDEIVGVHFGLASKGRFYYLLPGIDYERLERFSPGLLMVEDMIADCLAKGFEHFDFTIGDEAHKRKFGTSATPIYTLWHGHSLLGSMGVTFAQVLKKGGMGHQVNRWLTPEPKRALA